MSEYQYYEFLALDRPLSAKQMAELRAISTRAEISSTRFFNEYHWGELKADPAKLLQRYFDAHLYFASWGTYRLMLRLPKARVDVKRLAPYFTRDSAAQLSTRGDHVILDLQHDMEDGGHDFSGSLATLAPLRQELLSGDLRPAYLAWILTVQTGGIDETSREPPIPERLGTLSSAQRALIDLLDIDSDLLHAPTTRKARNKLDAKAFRRWVLAHSNAEKDKWLDRTIAEPDLALGSELLSAFQAAHATPAIASHRTVRDVLALAVAKREARRPATRARKTKQRATRG